MASARAIRALLVDNDVELSRVVREFLEPEGVEVHVLPDGETAITELDKIRADVVLIEISLPGSDGLSLCRKLRSNSVTPIITMSGRDDLELRVRALDDGADDFMLKPVDLRELLARVRAHVRRARGELVLARDRIAVGSLVIDLARRGACVRGLTITLTTAEFAVLALLAQRAGRPVTRDELLQAQHGTEDAAFQRSIDVLISRLRSKLELDPRTPTLIKTVRGAGYMLEAPRV